MYGLWGGRIDDRFVVVAEVSEKTLLATGMIVDADALAVTKDAFVIVVDGLSVVGE